MDDLECSFSENGRRPPFLKEMAKWHLIIIVFMQKGDITLKTNELMLENCVFSDTHLPPKRKVGVF